MIEIKHLLKIGFEKREGSLGKIFYVLDIPTRIEGLYNISLITNEISPTSSHAKVYEWSCAYDEVELSLKEIMLIISAVENVKKAEGIIDKIINKT